MNLNCNLNNSPQFGMALKLDKSALPVIKEQAAKLSPKKSAQFLSEIDLAAERQKENPVNIILRKAKHRKALVAEIVDSKAASKNLGVVQNQTTSQFPIFSAGNTRFIKRAEKEANKLNNINSDVQFIADKIGIAEKVDYKA